MDTSGNTKMSIEQKAKAYDEALERAKQKHGKFSEFVTKTIEEIFPELRESEDERIRTLLVALVQWAKTFNQSGLDLDIANKMLSYLEKQKINTEGDFGRGYDCGYQAGYAVAMNEMKPKVATATPDSCKDPLHISETYKENTNSFTDEDERMRELIIDRVRSAEEMTEGLRELLLTYLEKQKEQKPISSCDIVPYIDDKIAALQDMWREEKVAFDWDDMHEMIEDVARHFYQKEQKPNYSHHEVDETGWTEEYRKAYYDGWNNCNMQHEQLKEDQKPAEKQDYSGLTDLERVIHRCFLSAGVENVPVAIIKETAKECLGLKPTERNEEVFDKIDKSFRKGREVGFQEGVESVKPAEWSDDDEQYLLICKNALNKYQRSDQWDANIISNWLEKRLKSSLRLQPKQEWSEEEEETIIEGACSALEIYGHTKLASRLKSLRPQPKQELSKKDKKILQSLHSVMNCADAQNAVKRNGLSVADVCNFLFSIEPYWKPSEEQMKALQSARFLYRDGLENSATASALESLYLDLKKL